MGFLLAGLLAVGSFAWALTYPKASATFLDQATGRPVTIHSSGAPLSDQWESYLNLVEDSLENLPDDWNPLLGGKLAGILADACIPFVPQVTVALVGALLFWLIALVAGAAIRAVRCRRSHLVAHRIEGFG